jgi:hypothetical protein
MAQEQRKDLRDLGEPPFGKPDPVVAIQIQEVIEYLTNHMEVPTLGSFKLFLLDQLEWVEKERRFRQSLARLPK